LPGKFLHASPVSLPLESASIDVAYVGGLLETAQDPQAVIDEIYRVLNRAAGAGGLPGMVRRRFWQRCVFFWKRWLGANPRHWTSDAFHGARLEKHFGRFADIASTSDNCGARRAARLALATVARVGADDGARAGAQGVQTLSAALPSLAAAA